MMFNRKISTVVSFFVLFLVSASFAGEHFVPITSYRTGPYGVNGAPAANGFVDYLKMINAFVYVFSMTFIKKKIWIFILLFLKI